MPLSLSENQIQLEFKLLLYMMKYEHLDDNSIGKSAAIMMIYHDVEFI